MGKATMFFISFGFPILELCGLSSESLKDLTADNYFIKDER